MRLVPRSLFGRLLGLSVIATLAALLAAGFAIGNVLERVVMRGLDARLDAQLAVLARAVRPDGTLDPARSIDLDGFDEAGSGWAWRAAGPGGARWRNSPIAPPPLRWREPRGPPFERGRPRPSDGRGRYGERLHVRTTAVATPAGIVTLTASGPRRIVDAPLREAMTPLLGSLALLGAALGAATLLQLRLGLRPLGALQASLAEVRAGRIARVPDDQPRELQPLAAELNALIGQNEAGLAHARQHVANLAHGLKTPLAALAVRLGEDGRDPDGALRAAVGQIDGRVRHHLGRARAAAPGGAGRVRTPLAPAAADLIEVLRRVHAERRIAIRTEIAPDLAVAVDPQDLDEMIGNLLDNAWRHARSAVRIGAAADGGSVALTIEDDGPGLDDAAIGEALVPGRRLDERGDGHGFGLPIARELAELYGGALTPARSPAMGGLRVRLTLPAR